MIRYHSFAHNICNLNYQALSETTDLSPDHPGWKLAELRSEAYPSDRSDQMRNNRGNFAWDQGQIRQRGWWLQTMVSQNRGPPASSRFQARQRQTRWLLVR